MCEVFWVGLKGLFSFAVPLIEMDVLRKSLWLCRGTGYYIERTAR